MTNQQPDIVAVGHIVHETICFPDCTVGPVLGGPPAYSLVTAAKLGVATGIVTKIGDDFPPSLLSVFGQVGIDMTGICRCAHSTKSELFYDAQGNKEIRFPSRADCIGVEDFPSTYRSCQMVYVCTMEDDIALADLPAVAKLGQRAAIDLGGYGGVHMSKARRAQIDDLPAYATMAARCFDFVKASEEDCRALFGPGHPAEYARRLLAGNPQAVLITLGGEGVIVATPEDCLHVPALTGNPVDVTGGGDAFMGGFLSEYLRCGDVLTSAVFASATALCVIEKTEGITPDRMPTREQVRNRIKAEQTEFVLVE